MGEKLADFINNNDKAVIIGCWVFGAVIVLANIALIIVRVVNQLEWFKLMNIISIALGVIVIGAGAYICSIRRPF